MTGDHEVLTQGKLTLPSYNAHDEKEQGWVSITEGKLLLECHIATLNPETQKVEYRKPTHVWTYMQENEEPLIRFCNANVDILVTSKHRLWTRENGLQTAEELLQDETWSAVHFQTSGANGDVTVQDVRVQREEMTVETLDHATRRRRRGMVGPACWTGNSSRHGQKNTLGKAFSSEDSIMDEETGETPDFKLDTVCLTSRMTMGQLREMMFGLKAVETGRIQNGRPFQKRNARQITLNDGTVLSSDHFLGYRTFIDGRSGARIRVMLFQGKTNASLVHRSRSLPKGSGSIRN
jgi:hypothetical protein